MENQFASYFLKMNSKSTFFLTNTSFEMFKNKAKTFLILNNFLIKIRVKNYNLSLTFVDKLTEKLVNSFSLEKIFKLKHLKQFTQRFCIKDSMFYIICAMR